MDSTDLMQFAANAKTNLATVDWPQMAGALGNLAEQALKPVLVGEADDLKAFGLEIGRDMVSAIMRGDLAWEGRLNGQLRLLAEKGRIRTQAVSLEFAEQALGFVFHAALIGAGAAKPF